MKVRMSDDFKVAYKRLKKRHRSLEADFERLLLSLMENPEHSSKRRGRSGGARVIIRARIVEDELQLIYIYDKADYENISDTFLRDMLKRMQ